MTGMAWQTTHVAETYKNTCPYNATKTFQQLLVGQKQKDQNHRLVTNPWRSMAQKYN